MILKRQISSPFSLVTLVSSLIVSSNSLTLLRLSDTFFETSFTLNGTLTYHIHTLDFVTTLARCILFQGKGPPATTVLQERDVVGFGSSGSPVKFTVAEVALPSSRNNRSLRGSTPGVVYDCNSNQGLRFALNYHSRWADANRDDALSRSFP